ncbi:hypothetical protein DP64_06725 [Stutzerimonas degradans]|nr:hypothetical protein DP64_06725 [Stutzerimonas degradans]
MGSRDNNFSIQLINTTRNLRRRARCNLFYIFETMFFIPWIYSLWTVADEKITIKLQPGLIL